MTIPAVALGLTWVLSAPVQADSADLAAPEIPAGSAEQADNLAVIRQSGDGQIAAIVQTGTGNVASITQSGAGDRAQIMQTGDNHIAVIRQLAR